MLCNWGGTLGQQTLIYVKSGLDPIRAPYHVEIDYDLRPVLRSLVGVDSVYLVALDAEKLRRKGTGSGLDALQCSANWIARDCICSQSGRMKPLTAWKCPGKVHMSLQPSPSADQEAVVLLRIIAVRFPHDPQDWTALGAAAVLRVDTVGDMLQPDSLNANQQEHILTNQAVDFAESASRKDESDCWGVRVQQLLDFHEEIKDDVERYCSSHCVCMHEGDYKSFHVCLQDPCPFRKFNSPKYDDHRGVPFINFYRLRERTDLCPLIPNISFVVKRYIVGAELAEKNCSLLIKPREPLKAGVYISHTGADCFADFVETLACAFDPDDAVFVSGFARAHDAIAKTQKDGLEPSGQHPCAKALQNAHKMVVIVDKSLSFTQCLWCIYDIRWAKEWRIASFVWPHKAVDLLELRQTINELDLERLVASNAEDEYNFRNAIDANNLDLQAVSQQLREFLQERLMSFTVLFQHVTDLKEISSEKMRTLYVDDERRLVLNGFERVFGKESSEANRNVEILQNELTCLHRKRKAELHGHAMETQSLAQKMSDTSAKHQKEHLQLEKDMKDKLAELHPEATQLKKLFQEANWKTTQAQQQLAVLRVEQVEIVRDAAESSQRAEAAILRADTAGDLTRQKQEAILREEERNIALVEELEEARAVRDVAIEARREAEQTLLLCQDKIERLKAHNVEAGEAIESMHLQFMEEDEEEEGKVMGRMMTKMTGVEGFHGENDHDSKANWLAPKDKIDFTKTSSLNVHRGSEHHGKGFSLVSAAGLDYDQLMEEMRSAVEVRDVVWLGTKYDQCVDAKEIVNWLVLPNGVCSNREDAVQVGRDLQTQSYIVHSWGTSRIAFSDNTMFFRYCAPSKERDVSLHSSATNFMSRTPTNRSNVMAQLSLPLDEMTARTSLTASPGISSWAASSFRSVGAVSNSAVSGGAGLVSGGVGLVSGGVGLVSGGVGLVSSGVGSAVSGGVGLVSGATDVAWSGASSAAGLAAMGAGWMMSGVTKAGGGRTTVKPKTKALEPPSP